MNYLRKAAAFFLTILLFCGCFGIAACAADDTLHGIGFIITTKLRLYAKPSSQSQVIDIATQGECIIISRINDNWCRVFYNNQEGYMRSDCLRIAEAEEAELGNGKITNADVVYLRSGPGTEYSILSSGFRGNEFYTLGLEHGWFKILKDNETCYVRSDYFKLSEIPYENEDSEKEPKYFTLGELIGEIDYTESEQVAAVGAGEYYGPISPSRLLSDAQTFIGVPYVFGGTSPDGFDCSGLVYYCLALQGNTVPRTAAGQFGMGSPVDRANLMPGDLVFFENTYTSGVSHVGIYAGGGSFLHAPNEGSSVSYSNLSGYWADHYCGARRLA